MGLCGCDDLDAGEHFGYSYCNGGEDEGDYMEGRLAGRDCALTIPTGNDTGIPDLTANLDDTHRRKHSNKRGSGPKKYRGSLFGYQASRFDISDASTFVCLPSAETNRLLCADPFAGTSFLYGYGPS